MLLEQSKIYSSLLEGSSTMELQARGQSIIYVYRP